MPPKAWRPNAFRWQIAEPWDGTDDLARRLRTGRLIAQLLHNRGLDDAEAARAYLTPKLADLHDPEALSGAAEAAERIIHAVRSGEKIVLYGDYDVDGMAGLAILYRGLKLLGADVGYYIPHRVDEGYGLNVSAIETIASGGAKLVVTIDCGITAIACAERAAELGLSLIVTDHHNPGLSTPPADAVVHPAIGGSYPNPHLCGAGVALKLAWQICRTACGARRVTEQFKAFLLDATCLAALGTVADVVPLVGENRVLASFGLKGLPVSEHPGLMALIAAAGLAGRCVGEYDVGFLLAPRLNAAGRMGHAAQAAELLIRAEEIDCEAVARSLTAVNAERQKVQQVIHEQAIEMILETDSDRPDRRVIVLARQGWHAGVIGIVAARLVEQFHRPAVLIALDGDTGSGSGRSIAGYHLAEALTACGEHLQTHGGHAMAAGLRVAAKDVSAFTEALTDHAHRHIGEEMLTPSLRIDAAVKLGELSVPVVRQIESMAPFGAGNPPVVLAVRDAVLCTPAKRMGQAGKTLCLLLGTGRERLRCVGFGMGDAAENLIGVRTVHVAGQPVINRFGGQTSVEMHLKDLLWD
ncbi:MAG: single-stranded-DNA-specific exonuclease RecJ [Planctomycetes bacterium]|nr:single-stranded-DNA-specific exonuclease RecJ [Planctomycetota bacterium]